MYFSVTNMDVDAQKGVIVLSIRIFTDDLETILHNKYNVDGWIGTPNEHRDSRRLLMEYLNERFSITVNHVDKMALVTDSLVVDDEESVMWFYLKGVAQQPIRKIEVDNRLLTDFFSSQNNMLIISVNRKEIKWDNLNRKKYKIELSI